MSLMDLPDWQKQYSTYYVSRPDQAEFINVPAMQFVMIDGQGSPANAEFGTEGIALYRLARLLQTAQQRSGWKGYEIGPLEALWWPADDQPLHPDRPEAWRWTAMLMLPGATSQKTFDRIVLEAWSETNDQALTKVRLEEYTEGTVVQALHVGHPARKAGLIEQMRAAALTQGYQLHGKHHEIYLNTPMQVPPEQCRTIVRQPIKK